MSESRILHQTQATKSWKSCVGMMENTAMPRKPIGVWFSIALLPLIGGAAVGWKAGKQLAVVWHHHQQQSVGSLPSIEREHIDSVTSALSEVTLLRLIVASTASDPSKQQTVRQYQIEALNRLRERTDLADIRPILDLNLAADEASLAQISRDPQQAAQSMQSARMLVQSLGWEDSSDEALRLLAKAEADFLRPGIFRKVPK